MLIWLFFAIKLSISKSDDFISLYPSKNKKKTYSNFACSARWKLYTHTRVSLPQRDSLENQLSRHVVSFINWAPQVSMG